MAVTPVGPVLRDSEGGKRREGGDGSAGAGEDYGRHFEDFDKGLRDAVDDALNVSSWTSGERMGELEERLIRNVRLAVENETEMAPRVMQTVRDNIKDAKDASRESGIYSVTPEQISATLGNVLFNGLVEACDGTRVTYDTLPISVIQIGICMSSYLGDGEPISLGHRLFRHDIVRDNGNPADEVLAFIQQRERKSRSNEMGEMSGISDMMVRAIMGYGERFLLTEKSTKPWRMGHGTPMPYEMMTGSGSGKIIQASLDLLPKLLAGHKKFVFVPSDTSNAAIKTIANALRPLQYAVLTNTEYVINGYTKYLDEGNLSDSYRGQYRNFRPKLKAFTKEVASKVLIGVYKASHFSPGNIFYAHEDHVHEAALIAIADSALQEHRGFPNLIDIADRLCRGTFEPSGIAASVNAVFAEKGEPFRYLLERSTRA
jgi:hypothetical protein